MKQLHRFTNEAGASNDCDDDVADSDENKILSINISISLSLSIERTDLKLEDEKIRGGEANATVV